MQEVEHLNSALNSAASKPLQVR